MILVRVVGYIIAWLTCPAIMLMDILDIMQPGIIVMLSIAQVIYWLTAIKFILSFMGG